jgi:hypothetical protein
MGKLQMKQGKKPRIALRQPDPLPGLILFSFRGINRGKEEAQ